MNIFESGLDERNQHIGLTVIMKPILKRVAAGITLGLGIILVLKVMF